MSKPNIEIGNVRVVSGTVEFEATVAGHAVKLALPNTFVEDEIGGTDVVSVEAYFRRHDDDIRTAAWAAAYEHSTRDKGPNDPPSPVPYIGGIRKPYDQIRILV